MSVFNNGGGTLKATHKPAALLEMSHFLAEAERLASTADNPLNNITISFDLEGKTAAISATLPIAASLSANGTLVIAATNYIGVGSAFSGGNADLKSAHASAAFLEMAQIVAASEAAVPAAPNNVTIAMDLEAGTATATISLPISSVSDAAGRVVVAASDYLP